MARTVAKHLHRAPEKGENEIKANLNVFKHQKSSPGFSFSLGSGLEGMSSLPFARAGLSICCRSASALTHGLASSYLKVLILFSETSLQDRHSEQIPKSPPNAPAERRPWTGGCRWVSEHRGALGEKTLEKRTRERKGGSGVRGGETASNRLIRRLFQCCIWLKRWDSPLLLPSRPTEFLLRERGCSQGNVSGRRLAAGNRLLSTGKKDFKSR